MVYELVMELLYESQVAIISGIMISCFMIMNNVIVLVLDYLNNDPIMWESKQIFILILWPHGWEAVRHISIHAISLTILFFPELLMKTEVIKLLYLTFYTLQIRKIVMPLNNFLFEWWWLGVDCWTVVVVVLNGFLYHYIFFVVK